jgi:hypothetical protein
LVTSRRITTIEHEFRKAPHIEIRASDEDVGRHLQDQAEEKRRLKHYVEADPASQDTIINAIAGKGQKNVSDRK